MNEPLLRQRRNLFTTSALLFVLRGAGITVTKFTLAGFEVSVANPGFIYGCLWAVFGYFLYRYYQYFTAEGLTKLRETFAGVLDEKSSAAIYARVKASVPEVEPGLNYTYRILKNSNWSYRAQRPERNTDGAIVQLHTVEVPISRWDLRFPIARALAEINLRNSVVTDYLLPFFVAGFVIWYCGRGEWLGSFASIFSPT